MSRASKQYTLLSAVSASGAGTAQDVSKYTRFTAVIFGTGTVSGTLAIQGTLDGTNWASINSTALSSTTPTVLNFEGTYYQIRANMTTYSTGAFTAQLQAAEN